MSAYSTSSVLSTATVIEACWRCGAPTPSDGNIQPVHCAACQRMGADIALNDAFFAVRALRRGEPPFDVLSASERAAQLALIVNDGAPDPIERQRIELDDEQYHRELTLQMEREAAEQSDESRVIYNP
jgi:hypothetical protein